MTIIYQYRVATTSLGGFLKLLVAWRGSVYKLLFKETLIFCLLYAALSLTYRLALSATQRTQMERLVIHCNSYTNFIPISFVLGFYVTVVVGRWWQQFQNVPWPDRTLFVLCTYLNGQEERSRMMRRGVARYMLFGLLLIMRSVSLAVMKRFPTIDTIVEAGFITKEEAETYEQTQCRYLKFWVPLMWANNVIARARREGFIETEFGLRMVLEQLADYRDKCSLCFVYDWITIPLVYTQVVTLAVYSFFAACVLGRQFLDPAKGYPDYQYDSYVPVFTLLQFTFYMGWLKVAEQMINPFGEDDDDYDINWLLDRHTAVAFALVDQCCGVHPPLVRDHFWDEAVMPEMPYTEASQGSKRPNFLGSTFNINHLSSEDQRAVTPSDPTRLRRRSQGSYAGSVLSLFSFKPHNRLLSGSRDTLDSGDHGCRHLSVPNGRVVGSTVPLLDDCQDKSRSVSLDMTHSEDALRLAIPESRERSFSERSERADSGQRVRKLSSPSRLHFFTKRDSHKNPASPKPSRFTVEPVDDSDQAAQHGETGEGGGGVGGRKRRSGQHVLSMLHAATSGGSKAVSRPPLLSAIEEGNTVTSLRQLLPRSDSDDTTSLTSNDDIFSDLTVASSGLEEIMEDHRELDVIDSDSAPGISEGPLSTSRVPICIAEVCDAPLSPTGQPVIVSALKCGVPEASYSGASDEPSAATATSSAPSVESPVSEEAPCDAPCTSPATCAQPADSSQRCDTALSHAPPQSQSFQHVAPAPSDRSSQPVESTQRCDTALSHAPPQSQSPQHVAPAPSKRSSQPAVNTGTVPTFVSDASVMCGPRTPQSGLSRLTGVKNGAGSGSPSDHTSYGQGRDQRGNVTCRTVPTIVIEEF
ncbi:bestrophin homolog 17-like [Littorina saxatilis]|uniref:Bestrophin homolog n=1 Tax=Littorina saxatilis TaxID=31220 RepID=A0AAN9GFH1_9CAEN